MNLLKHILPSQKKFTEILKEQIEKIEEATLIFGEFLNNGSEPERMAKQIKEIERRGDKLVYNIYREVYSSFITPIDDDDLLALASSIDDVLDHIYGAARRFAIYKLRPNSTVKRQIEILSKSSAILKKVIGEKKLPRIKEAAIKVHEAEEEADKLFYEHLRCEKKKRDCITVVNEREVCEKLEAAIDALENVMDIVLDIAIKER